MWCFHCPRALEGSSWFFHGVSWRSVRVRRFERNYRSDRGWGWATRQNSVEDRKRKGQLQVRIGLLRRAGAGHLRRWMLLLLGSSRGGSDNTEKLVPVPLGLSTELPQQAHAQASQYLLHLLSLLSYRTGRLETLDFILFDFCYVVKTKMWCIGTG